MHLHLPTWCQTFFGHVLPLKPGVEITKRMVKGRTWIVSRRSNKTGRKRIEMMAETQNHLYARKLANWWADQDPNCFYYITEAKTKFYAPREDLEALGLPATLDWDLICPEIWEDTKVS
jgi:hypothetical protein